MINYRLLIVLITAGSLSLPAAVGEESIATPADLPLSSFERKTFKRGVGNLSLLQRRGEGVPLVLLPGTFSDSSQWAETVEHLPQDRPLVLIELRGQGESWPPKPVNSVKELAQDTLWVLSTLGLERFHVGGHSLGGMVALEMGRVAPDRICSVLSIEGWTHHLVAEEAFGGVIRNTLSPAQEKERAEERALLEAKWGKARMVEFAQVWKRWDGFEFLKTTQLPVLEIWGDRNSKPRPSRDQLRIPDRANIRLEWIEGASHALPTEKPGEIGRLITEFLEKSPACD